jgi:hypothetical protein
MHFDQEKDGIKIGLAVRFHSFVKIDLLEVSPDLIDY